MTYLAMHSDAYALKRERNFIQNNILTKGVRYEYTQYNRI